MNKDRAPPHIALIVDNPLRDLDGLVLLGRYLVSQGARVSLVPMYDQGFDIPVLKPDLVLLNYIRTNNLDLIKRYRMLGIRVGVLDTEGIAGKDPDDFARFVSRTGHLDLVDVYCLWGRAQKSALLRLIGAKAERFEVTGCPRYDFCAPRWRGALARFAEPGYVLINTNFPAANPRFAESSGHESRTLIAAGFASDLAHRVVAEGRAAHARVTDAVRRLALRFPEARFVLRPHPFERISAYDTLASLANVSVRQEGTSLEWLAGARLLLHQNCSTAIEAAMLGVPAVSFEWFNTPTLRLEVACGVSHPAGSYEALEAMVAAALDRRAPEVGPALKAYQDDVIQSLYLSLDGHAAERVGNVLLAALDHRVGARPGPYRPSWRGRMTSLVRQGLGHKGAMRLRDLMDGAGARERRRKKAFSAEDVRRNLERLARASTDGLVVSVEKVAAATGGKLMVNSDALFLEPERTHAKPNLSVEAT